MAIADSHGLPIAIGIASASPHETKLVDDTLDDMLLDAVPERLFGDRACDSDKLNDRLRHQRAIEMIVPHSNIPNRRRTQDGRLRRRYCRRWQVERLFAWLYNFRRLDSRSERHGENFLLRLGCVVILLRHF